MTKELSNAAAEREAAKLALANGELKDRETYSAKQVALRCGTDAKTMRKFFRSKYSTVEPVGQGGRYEFDARDLPKIKREFNNWLNRSTVKDRQPVMPPTPKGRACKKCGQVRAVNSKGLCQDCILEGLKDPEAGPSSVIDLDIEPTDEELMELEDLDLDMEG